MTPSGSATEKINFDQATSIARRELTRDPQHSFVLLMDQVKEYPFGWIFQYAPKRFLETHNPNDAVPGTGPIVVNRDGSVERLSTSGHPSAVINEYVKRRLDTAR
jgi:hypothetical protein